MKLSNGYSLVYKEDIQPNEVLMLRKSVGWEPGDTNEGWLANITGCIAAVGVREQSGNLVGIGFVVGNRRHAVLCDFNVHPDHQGKGLGTAILKERMKIIDELKIPFVYTSLSSVNPLVSVYKSFGFKSTGDNYFRNSSEHTS